MGPNLPLVLVILIVTTLLSWWLERDFVFLRQDQKRALRTLLLLTALGSLTVYACQAITWEPGSDSWLVRLLILAVCGLALWLAQRT